MFAWKKSQELLNYSLKTLNCKLYIQLEVQDVKTGFLKALVRFTMNEVGHWQPESSVRMCLLHWACKISLQYYQLLFC